MRDPKSLIAWRTAHSVVLDVYRVCRRYWHPSGSAIFDQLQRAALSVQLNIAEGHALGSVPKFRQHLTIANGSSVETIECLELLPETGLMRPDTVGPILDQAILDRGLLLGLLRRYRR